MNDADVARAPLPSAGRFFGFAFLVSWAFWIPVAILRPPFAVAMPLVILGAFGPSLTGAFLMHRYAAAPARRDFWARVLDPRRIGARWWLLILALFPMIGLAAGWISRAVGGAAVRLDTATLSAPLPLLGFIGVMVVGGPLAEELGWRGYALDRLQAAGSPLAASIRLGAVWAIWHTPLFFMPETSQGAMGFGSEAFWLWTVEVLALAVIYTWVYNNTNRSILGAIALHFMGNSTFTLLAGLGGKLPRSFEVASTALHVVVACGIAIAWRADGPDRLREPASAAAASG